MSTPELELLQRIKLPFADLLGLEFVAATKEMVRAELLVRPEICTRPATIHGGAIMAFADTLGAAGTVVNLPPGHSTTTIESKTNFLSGAPAGTTIIGEATPIHRGKRTQVWQTRITRASDGGLVAIVTQTQMVLEPRPPKA